MNDHAEIQPLLADLARGTLDGDVRAGMETHVAECVECREWLDTYAFLARSLASGNAVEHPEAGVVATWAVDEAALAPDVRASLADHFAACPACRAQVDMVRQAIRDSPRPVPMSSGRRWSVAGTVAIAAGLMLAVAGGAALFHNASAVRELAAIQDWSGTVGYVVIEDAQRGTSPEPRMRLRAGQPFALVAFRLDLSSDLARTTSVEVELFDAGGGRVWTTTLPAQPLRDDVSAYGAAFLPIPSRALVAGSYEVRVTAIQGAMRSLVLQRRLEIEFVK
jgi:hypothetical protein